MYVVRVYAPGLCVALRAGVSRRPFPSLQHAPRRDFTASIKECFSLGSMHRTSPQNVMSTHACARAHTHTHMNMVSLNNACRHSPTKQSETRSRCPTRALPLSSHLNRTEALRQECEDEGHFPRPYGTQQTTPVYVDEGRSPRPHDPQQRTADCADISHSLRAHVPQHPAPVATCCVHLRACTP